MKLHLRMLTCLLVARRAVLRHAARMLRQLHADRLGRGGCACRYARQKQVAADARETPRSGGRTQPERRLYRSTALRSRRRREPRSVALYGATSFA